MAREAAIVRKLMGVLTEAGGYAVKLHGSAHFRAGEPDIIGCFLSQTVVIEAKGKPGSGVEPIQAHRLKGWKRAGAEVLIAPTVEELRQCLAQIRARHGG